MNTITIQIPDGMEIDNFDKATGVVKFKEKPRDVKERIKTIEDLLKAHGLDQEEFDGQCNGLEDDEIGYRFIKLLAKSLNEGWLPDWDNSNEYKYFPWFYMQNGSPGFRVDGFGTWSANSATGSRLCFKTRELAEYAGKQFVDVYKKFMIIE